MVYSTSCEDTSVCIDVEKRSSGMGVSQQLELGVEARLTEWTPSSAFMASRQTSRRGVAGQINRSDGEGCGVALMMCQACKKMPWPADSALGDAIVFAKPFCAMGVGQGAKLPIRDTLPYLLLLLFVCPLKPVSRPLSILSAATLADAHRRACCLLSCAVVSTAQYCMWQAYQIPHASCCQLLRASYPQTQTNTQCP